MGDYATRADDAPRTDCHARTNDSPAANPHVRADLDRLAELLLAAQLCVKRVGGSINLHPWAKQCVISDFDLADIEYDAVEVEKALLPDQYVEPVVAEEWRLYPHVLASCAQQFLEDALTLLVLGKAHGIEVLTQVPRPVASAD